MMKKLFCFVFFFSSFRKRGKLEMRRNFKIWEMGSVTLAFLVLGVSTKQNSISNIQVQIFIFYFWWNLLLYDLFIFWSYTNNIETNAYNLEILTIDTSDKS
jgi:hypothetical protein